MKHPFPLRHAIPSLLLLFGVLLGGVTIWSDVAGVSKRIEAGTRGHLTSLGYRVSDEIEHYLSHNEPSLLGHIISMLGTEPHLRLALLCDEKNVILASTEPELASRSFAESGLEGMADLSARARETSIARTGLSRDGNTMVGVFPVQLGLLPGELRFSRIGILYIEVDLRGRKQIYLAESLRKLAVMGGVVFLLLLAVWFYLNAVITRRAARLIELTEKWAGGSLSLRADLQGGDELALLGASFNRMAAALQQQTETLLKSETGLRASEAELRRISALLNRIVENIPDVIFLKDAGELRFVLFNRAGEEATGYSRNDLLGKNDYDLFPKEEADFFTATDRETLRGNAVVEIPEEPLRTSQGSVRMFHTKKVPILDADGTPEYLLGISEDITDRKRAEEALARAAKLESIGTLAAGIAHDFNNLLAVVFGFMELSQIAAEKAKQREIAGYLAQARGAFERARDLTQQLLTFSKGGAPIRKTLSLAAQVRRTISFSLSGSNVEAEFNIPDEIWLSDFDENQIGQVLDNMVINARQAMPRGGVLDVSMRNIARSEAPEFLPPKNYVCVSIRDHGSGIAREHLPHIFDPFFTTKTMGSGLGLATSHSIISQHGGFIGVDSVEGRGTTFDIYLPTSSGAASVEEVADQNRQRPGKGVILLMDDEELILDVLSLMLEEIGYRTVKTQNGEEAKEEMKSAFRAGEPFLAAILDLTIPGGPGGREILRSLKALDPSIKAIASSGYADDPVMSSPSAYGFVGRLIKPYQRKDLLVVLGSLFPEST